jgi:undecaprenyl-diphosphatase
LEILYAIIVGIVQGLTEFLPISSTAHMTIVAKLIGGNYFSDPKIWTASMATIQLGTMLSLLFYFRNELLALSKSFARENIFSLPRNIANQSYNSRLGWAIGFGSIPIFVIGYLLKDFIESDATKSLFSIALALIIVAVFMLIAEVTGKFAKTIDKITFFDAILIGLAQTLALFPGVSRSGATITAGLFLGYRREDSARFSFLLSIPAVLVSGVYEFISNYHNITKEQIIFVLIATFFAFISGIFAISFLLKYLQKKSTLVFIVYRILLGIIILLWLV